MILHDHIKDMEVQHGIRNYAIEYERENGLLDNVTLHAANKQKLVDAWDAYIAEDKQDRAEKAGYDDGNDPESTAMSEYLDGDITAVHSVKDVGSYDMARRAMGVLEANAEQKHLYDVEMEFSGLSEQAFGKTAVMRFAAQGSEALSDKIKEELESTMAVNLETGDGPVDYDVLANSRVRSIKRVDRENKFSFNLGYGNEDLKLEVLDGEARQQAFKNGSGFPLALVYADGDEAGKVAAMAIQPVPGAVNKHMTAGIVNPDVPGLDKALEACGVISKTKSSVEVDDVSRPMYQFHTETLEIMGVKGADTYQNDHFAYLGEVRKQDEAIQRQKDEEHRLAQEAEQEAIKATPDWQHGPWE